MSEPDSKLQFDRELLAVYLTGLQAEVEAKLRSVTRFREKMRQLDEVGARTSREQREAAAQALLSQVDAMIETNRVVREILHELRTTAQALLDDVRRTADTEG